MHSKYSFKLSGTDLIRLLINPIALICYALLILIVLFTLEIIGTIDLSELESINALINFIVIVLFSFLIKFWIESKQEEVRFYENMVKNYNRFKLIRRKIRNTPFDYIEFDSLQSLFYDLEDLQLEFEVLRDTFEIKKSILWAKPRDKLLEILNEIEKDLRGYTQYLKEDNHRKEWNNVDPHGRKKIFRPFYNKLNRSRKRIEFFAQWN